MKAVSYYRVGRGESALSSDVRRQAEAVSAWLAEYHPGWDLAAVFLDDEPSALSRNDPTSTSDEKDPTCA